MEIGDTKETKREYLNRVYKENINPKYSGKEMNYAIPNILIDLVLALEDYKKEEKWKTSNNQNNQ